MTHYLSKLASSLCIGAVLHLQVADAVYAQTSPELQGAASQANTGIFKPNPADLYQSGDGTVEIIGVSPGGEVLTLNPADMFYGIPGQSANEGTLPNINTYEDLYGYRDQQLGELETGGGRFGSTGELNAESAALEVLRGSSSIPSVGADSFLIPSRDLMDDPSDSTAEFGQCIIHQVQGEVTYDYENSVMQYCDSLAVDTRPMLAQRTYKGPDQIFDYGIGNIEGGIGQIREPQYGFQPEASWTGPIFLFGTQIIRWPGQANINLPRNSPTPFPASDGWTYHRERTGNQNGSGVFRTRHGGTTGAIDVPYCEFNGVRIEVDGPETCGKLSIFESIPTKNGYGKLTARRCNGQNGQPGDENCVAIVSDMDGQTDPIGLNFTISPSVNLTSANVRITGAENVNTVATYQGNEIFPPLAGLNIDEIRTTKGTPQRLTFQGEGMVSVREPETGSLSGRSCDRDDHCTYRYGFIATDRTSGSTDAYQGTDLTVRWAGATVYSQRGGRDLRNLSSVTVGECTYYKAVIRTGSGRDQTSQPAAYRICTYESGAGQLITRLTFDPETFTPWAYNEARWSEILGIISDQACTLDVSIDRSATKENGCVNSFISSNGRAGELCGPDIPVSPFEMLTDRGATEIRVQPNCQIVPEGDENDDAYTEGNSCSEYAEDESCTFIGRECIETLDNGQCFVYENRYSCGETLSYTSPVVEEINICNSDLSCLGDDCLPNTGTDGTFDLADAASKLAAVDMILTDMQCELDADAPNVEADMRACQLFQGKRETCSKVTLGLSDCCKNAKGISLTDYLQLAFSVSRVSRVVEGSALANPITSSWVSFENLGRDSFSSLTKPITETWESIIGNTGAAKGGAGAFSMEAVKQSMMKNAAQWTANIFGDQAANAIFQVGGGPAVGGGMVNPGSIGLTSGAASIMSAVMTAYTVYVLINAIVSILLACSKNEQELQVRKALRSTHEIGRYCSRRVLGKCVTRRTAYCMFNSPLSRIMNEQARLQLGISWGSPQNSNCRGITLEEFQGLDMERVDLSEWTGMLLSSGMLDMEGAMDIDALTGPGSTLGRAQEDLYPRENAIDRNLNRFDGIDMDGLREDAVNDFGMGIVQ